MRVHVLYGNRRRNPFRGLQFILSKNYFYPLVFARKELRDLGIEVCFFDDVSDAFFDCDSVFIASHQVAHNERLPWANGAAFGVYAEKLRSRMAGRLVWFDLRDSAGTPQFDVLPFVDLYCKQSLYRDRSLYRRRLYGNRLFTDYFYREQGICDEYDEAYAFLDESQERKVCVSWDIGARYNRLESGSIDRYFGLIREVGPVFLGGEVNVNITPPDAPHHIDLAALMSTERYSRRTIAHQRRLAIQKLSSYASDKVVVGKVARSAYANALRHSKIVLSCFGAGEICYREHEAWEAGACVMMPDMSALEVWPNKYRPRETYWPLKWDLADLEESMALLLSSEELRLEIARQGQCQFLWTFSPDGCEAFARRIADIASGRVPAS